MASAGTITDEDTTSSSPVTNVTPATESICPKGWTLPSTIQIHTMANDTPTFVSNFSPVLGGYYTNSTLINEDTYGSWLGSEVNTSEGSIYRRALRYNNGRLYAGSIIRNSGFYIRCINKQKTVLDLTYMQEMTPEIASIPPMLIAIL